VAKHNGRNAWVGIVPMSAPQADTVIPRRPTDLVRSSCFTPLTSIAGPLKWTDEP
jgi:hypothetical protein